ncbi:MAG: transglutaminase family protein [Thermodesulfobacteriota bacterium]
MNFKAVLLLFLISLSTVTFPVLAAEQLDTVNEGSSGIFGWLYSLIASLMSWGIKESPAVVELETKGVEDSGFSSGLMESIKDLERSALEYSGDMNDVNKAGFLSASDTFLIKSEEFVATLGEMPVEILLQEKLGEFSDRVKLLEGKADTGDLTRIELEDLVSEIESATGRRYEKVDFETYEEREIHPRVLGSGGEVLVASGQLTLPASVDSPSPLPEDYETSVDAPITPEIQELADRLDNDPAKIYWWVRENIRYEPYYGAMQGAEQTLVSRRGNDIDTASLLISLLRASGHPARYVYGEASATREEVFDLLGVDSVQEVLRLMWGAGIPSEFDGRGFVIERVWVETYVEPRPYLEGHWVQLDASWKSARSYTKIDDYVTVTSTIDPEVLQDGALSGAEINAEEGYITGIDTKFVDSYLDANVQTEILQDISEEFFIPEEKMPPDEVHLPLSMQFDFNKSYEYSTLPNALKYRVSIDIDSSEGSLLHYENFLPMMSGEPFVLDFAPATIADEQKIQNGAPAYEIIVTPRLYLGDDYTSGDDTMYGGNLNITLEISLVESLETSKKIYAWEKTAIVIDAPRTEFLAYNETFERVKSLQDAGDNKTLARESLYLIGSNFFLSSDFYTDGLADTNGMRWARAKPGIVFITKENKVESFDGLPIAVSNGGTSVDLKLDHVTLSASLNETVTFNLQRGMVVSAYEGVILEDFYDIIGVSALTIFNKAITENIPIHVITKDTLDRLNLLDISTGDKENIRELLQISSDYYAFIPAEDIQIGKWNGVGYAIIDIRTGTGKYLLSGGLAGGSTSDITKCVLKVIGTLSKPVIAFGYLPALIAVCGVLTAPTEGAIWVVCGPAINFYPTLLKSISESLPRDIALTIIYCDELLD